MVACGRSNSGKTVCTHRWRRSVGEVRRRSPLRQIKHPSSVASYVAYQTRQCRRRGRGDLGIVLFYITHTALHSVLHSLCLALIDRTSSTVLRCQMIYAYAVLASYDDFGKNFHPCINLPPHCRTHSVVAGEFGAH